jgi:hypothetical protein
LFKNIEKLFARNPGPTVKKDLKQSIPLVMRVRKEMTCLHPTVAELRRCKRSPRLRHASAWQAL